MLNIDKLHRLPSNRGTVGINWDGDIIIEQGRPHGVMANAGEAFLSPEDLKFINKLVRTWKKAGNKPLSPGTIRPL